MSKEGSVYVPIEFRNSPEKACLKAVDDCDLFLGIIFPRYGLGITHKDVFWHEHINHLHPRLCWH